MSGAVKKIAKVALPVAAIATGVGAVGAVGGALAAGSVATSAATTAGSLAAAAAGGGGGILSALGAVGSVVSRGSSILSAVNNIAGAFAGPASSFSASQSIEYLARQQARDQLTAAENFEYSAEISLINKSIAERNRVFEEQSNFATKERMARSNRRTLETGKAQYAVGGVTATGSAQDVLADMAMEGELNIALTDFESRHRQKGFEIQRDVFQKEADQYLKAANTAKENAANILKEGMASAKEQKYLSFADGIGAIPQIISGVEQLGTFFDAKST